MKRRPGISKRNAKTENLYRDRIRVRRKRGCNYLVLLVRPMPLQPILRGQDPGWSPARPAGEPCGNNLGRRAVC